MINIKQTFLSDFFLFGNLSEEEIEEIARTLRYEVKNYDAKEIIYAPDSYENKLGFVVSGECTVLRYKSNGISVPLNNLKKGDSFGIMAVLSNEEEFPTTVVAKRSTTVIFLTKQTTLELIASYPQIAMNAIDFLSNKIAFLNNKIATFSSDSVEAKLANYLMLEHKKRRETDFPFNIQRTAAELSVGRASLYRALASLSEEKIIKLENKRIMLINVSALKDRK